MSGISTGCDKNAGLLKGYDMSAKHSTGSEYHQQLDAHTLEIVETEELWA